MNSGQIRHFVLRYLEALQCEILETSPAHVTVKLSVEADKDLTNRTYYWSFVERTGAPPETMTFTFIFDKANMGASPAPGQPAGHVPVAGHPGPPAAAPGNSAPPAAADSILGRYFGVTVPSFTGRIPREEIVFGCRRLDQIFQSARNRGSCVQLFEEPETETSSAPPPALPSAVYSAWLAVNYKVELMCDMKRDELHSLGIQLTTGRIVEHFHERALKLRLSPKLPAGIRLQPNRMTLDQAADLLETYLENKLRRYDHSWARGARRRLQEELERVHSYYQGLLPTLDPEKRIAAQDEYFTRQKEIEWQYKPRIRASVVNCGLFHLKTAW
jgi:hypothetical protein